MYVLFYLSADSFLGFFQIYGDMPTISLRISFDLYKISVYEPSVLIIKVEPIDKIKHLLPNQSIIPINIHHNISSPTILPRRRIPITQSPHLILILQYSYPII